MQGFSIIIVTWNGLHHLQRFLPSVVATDYSNFEIILAENNSTDQTVEWVSATFPSIKIARFDDNYGYTGGNNRAVPFAEKENLIFLNNDVEVDANWLNSIADTLTEDEEVCALQPKIRSYKEPHLFEYAGAAGGYLDRLGYPFCRGRILDTVEQDNGQYDQLESIAWASGAALVFRKTWFEQLGGFDEDFEFHMEEIDLCWRLKNQHKKIVYCPNSVVYHLGGGSLPMGSARKVYYNFRNSLFMLWKNLPASQLWYKIFFRMVLDGVAAFRSLLSGKPQEFTAILKAHLHFYQKLPLFHKKRMGSSRASARKVLSPVLIVWQYFVLGKKKFTEIMP